jgi:hypothetical protein
VYRDAKHSQNKVFVQINVLRAIFRDLKEEAK